jgi:hypothetical protein
MTEIVDKTALLATRSETQVRSKLLTLASALADKAASADSSEEVRNYAESAAALFSAAKIRMGGDPIPDGG